MQTAYEDNDDHELLDMTLEIGDTDKYGNQHPDHAEYEAAMDRQSDSAIVILERPF